MTTVAVMAWLTLGAGPSWAAPSSSVSLVDGFDLRVNGAAASDFAGRYVSAGDLNGDGLDDVIVGAPFVNSSAGSAYVIYGKPNSTGTVDLPSVGTALPADQGFRINAASGDLGGYAVDGAGDVNGDKVDDLIVSAEQADSNADGSGSAFVIYGKQGSRGTVDLPGANADLPETLGFRIDGAAANDFSGYAVAGAGDLNSDGNDDVIVGVPYADTKGVNSGSAYVIYGQASTRGTVDLPAGDAALPEDRGFRIDGARAGDLAGSAVAGVGDVNGDEIDDAVVGAPESDPQGTNSGSAYVIYGKAGGRGTVGLPAATSALPEDQGFRIDGAADGAGLNSPNLAGRSVAAAGDVNGDGNGDVIVGAPAADPAGNASGSAFVVYGETGGRGTVSLPGGDAALPEAQGFRVSGAATRDNLGEAVAGGGDVDGDGVDDVVVGAPFADSNGRDSGSALVIYGRAGSRGTVALPDAGVALSPTQGFRIDGTAGDRAGNSVACVSDLNGDALADVVVGAPAAAPNGRSSGAAYIVDTKAPAAPAITAPTGGSTGLPTFNVAGTAEPNSSVELFDGAQPIAVTAAGADGKWALQLERVSDGVHRYAAKASDRVGNASPRSTAVEVTVDTRPAFRPSATNPRDTTAPLITAAGLSTARFSVDMRARASAKAKRGTKLTLRLSESATVVFVTEQRIGRRWRKVRIFGRRLPAGRSTIDYSGRIKPRGTRRALKPGRYRLRMRPSDRAGNKGRLTTIGFTIVRR